MPVIMAVQTADGHTTLDNALNTRIRWLQGPWAGGVGPGGVMTQGAIATMKRQNAIRAGPGVGEQWITACCSANGMAGITSGCSV